MNALLVWNMCEKKIRYKSRKSAENKLKAIKKTGKLIPSNAHAYSCPICFGFHLGHSKRKS